MCALFTRTRECVSYGSTCLEGAREAAWEYIRLSFSAYGPSYERYVAKNADLVNASNVATCVASARKRTLRMLISAHTRLYIAFPCLDQGDESNGTPDSSH